MKLDISLLISVRAILLSHNVFWHMRCYFMPILIQPTL